MLCNLGQGLQEIIIIFLEWAKRICPMKLCTVMGEGLEKIIIYFWNLPAYYAGVMGQGLEEDVSCISGMGENLTHYASVNEAGQRFKEPD